MVLLHISDYPIKVPQAPVFGGKLGFCNTGIGDRVYRNESCGEWICRKTGICIELKPSKGLRQIN